MEKLKAFSMFCSTRKMGTSWKMHVQTSMNMLGRDKECSSRTILYSISSFEKVLKVITNGNIQVGQHNRNYLGYYPMNFVEAQRSQTLHV